MPFNSFEEMQKAFGDNIDKYIQYDLTNENYKDPDQCPLAFDIYKKMLEAMGCTIEKVLLNNSNYNDSCISCLFGNKVQSVLDVRLVKEKIANIKIRDKANRSGFYFKYAKSAFALEVDTLFGPNFYRKRTEKSGEDDKFNLLHSIGNFGLIPFGAGRCAGPGGRTDAPYHKVETRFCCYPSGFKSSEKLGELLLYNKIDGALKGFYDIDQNSSKKEIEDCIERRGRKIVEMIKKTSNK